MDKNKILKNVLAKLETENNINIQKSVDDLLTLLEKTAIREPRNIIKLLQNFYLENPLTQQEAIKLMGKIQQKGIIDKSLRAHKDAEKAWRLILKTWKIPSFRLERGAY